VRGLDTVSFKALIDRYIEEGLVRLTILTEGEEREYEVVPAVFDIDPVSFELLEDGVGLIRVDNFDSRSGAQMINACKTLQEQGATALIFDLRFNPGGQLEELLQALDYLLPEGVIFLSQEKGEEMQSESSDAACLRLPMAVLVNSESYSAAEFFAAALQEYEWAVVVGEQTTGKGYAQITVSLSDGSAMHISARKYYTPKGVSLAGVGITPDVTAKLDDGDFRMLYYDRLDPADDEQLQAAIDSVKSEG
jgi:carboxyl-terminal processing protease